jgi:hypothetical protein
MSQNRQQGLHGQIRVPANPIADSEFDYDGPRIHRNVLVGLNLGVAGFGHCCWALPAATVSSWNLLASAVALRDIEERILH